MADSTQLSLVQVKNHISNNLRSDFTQLKQACGTFADNVNELQNHFYGPDTAVCTDSYKKIKDFYSSEGNLGFGIVGSLRSAFDWVDAADNYVTRWEREQNGSI